MPLEVTSGGLSLGPQTTQGGIRHGTRAVPRSPIGPLTYFLSSWPPDPDEHKPGVIFQRPLQNETTQINIQNSRLENEKKRGAGAQRRGGSGLSHRPVSTDLVRREDLIPRSEVDDSHLPGLT